MSWKDGVSQCWPLAEKCHVWWEAWSAVGAVVGVGATLFLGFMTLRVAKAANRVSRMAVKIASDEADAKAKLDSLEGLLVLARVQTEVTTVAGTAVILLTMFESTARPFVGDPNALLDWEEALLQLALPVTDALSDRLKYAPKEAAGQLSRSLGICDTLRREWTGAVHRDDLAELTAIWDALPVRLHALSADLNGVRALCIKAVNDLGINTPELVAKMIDAAEPRA